MNALATPLSPPRSPSPPDEIAGLLGPGVVVLDRDGSVRFADPRAVELLGCAQTSDLERAWSDLKPRLESVGLSWNGASGGSRAALDLDPARRLAFDLRHEGGESSVLLVQDLGLLTGIESDLRLTSQMRSVAQISPAVAHDLRAPINAMVFNIEILKEMLASGRAADPANRDKLLRYVSVLKEELSRLHKGLENFLAYISPRSDRQESMDLRELAEELAALLVAPARKQQAQVKAELPEGAIPLEGNRYLMRQALLHLALAALAGVPRQGLLHVRVERRDGSARLVLQGEAGPESPADAVPATPPPGLGEFGLRFSPEGALARLWVARSILAAHGGEARAVPSTDSAAGALPAYEVELSVPGNPEHGNKE